MRPARLAAVLVTALGVALLADGAAAQPVSLPPFPPGLTGEEAEAAASLVSPGWYVTPSFRLTEEFDDNVFATVEGKRSDFITRMSPGIRAGYRSVPFTLEAGFTFDAEIYANNTELSGPANRKAADLELRYEPDRRLLLEFHPTYVESDSATGLRTATGLQLGRVEATELLIPAAATYRFTERWTGKLAYTYVRTTFEDGPTDQLHRIELGASYRVIPTGTLLFGHRLSVFESDEFDTVVSNTPMIGWSQRLTARTTLTLIGGPRFTDGRVEPELYASIEHRLQRGRLSLTYARTEESVIGVAGPAEVESVIGSATYELARGLELRVSPAWRRITGHGADVEVVDFEASLAYRINRWASVRGAYRFSYQDADRLGDFTRNVVSIGLELGYPFRVR